MSLAPRPEYPAPGPDAHRMLPHSFEAEQGVLGSMLIAASEVLPEVEAQPPEIFYAPTHQTIFAMLVEMWRAGTPADLITVTQALRERGRLDAVGGAAYITSLIDFTPTAANAGYYLDTVVEKAALRRVISTCHDFANRAHDADVDCNELQDRFEAAALAAGQSTRAQTQGDDPRAGTDRAIESIQRIWEGCPDAVGLRTGIARLDNMISGLGASQLILLAARPGVGKSALAILIAASIAVDRSIPVGFFSLEMTEEQQRRRLLLSRARIDIGRLRERLVNDADFARLAPVAAAVAAAPLFIDDTRGLSIAELRARARRWHQKHGIGLLVVDYLQLLRSDSRQAQGSREREIAQVCEGLKTLARELEIPVLGLSQLSRESAKAGRPPRLEDLRESGALEQDADTVLLLHREQDKADENDDQPTLSAEASLFVAKQREGPTGPIRLVFIKEFCRFEERAREATVSRVSELG